MAAGEHLNEVQFASPHELSKYWDPNLKDPETVRKYSPRYIDTLAGKIRREGIQNPIQITTRSRQPSNRLIPGDSYIYDGHHRIVASMDLGLEKVPWKWVSGRPGEQ